MDLFEHGLEWISRVNADFEKTCVEQFLVTDWNDCADLLKIKNLAIADEILICYDITLITKSAWHHHKNRICILL